MQQRFSSYSNVVDAFAAGWKDGENPDWELLSAAFGFDLQTAWQGRSPYPDGIPQLMETTVWPSEKLIFLRYDAKGGGWFLAMRKKRWVVYPVTRWIEFVSARHAISGELVVIDHKEQEVSNKSMEGTQ